MKVDKFNIRVYGIVLHEEKLLLVRENLRGVEFVKLPGGGVEPGEGLLDALKREIKEELETEMITVEHFYTTEFFQRSAFRENEQVVSVYYLIRLLNNPTEGYEISEPDHILKFFWRAMSDFSSEELTFTIDRHVADMLISGRKESHPEA